MKFKKNLCSTEFVFLIYHDIENTFFPIEYNKSFVQEIYSNTFLYRKIYFCNFYIKNIATKNMYFFHKNTAFYFC